MYKGASRNLQHAHGVDRAHPSRGYIDGANDPLDMLPDVESLNEAQLNSERDRIKTQLAQVQARVMSAKAERDVHTVALMGQSHQVLQSRLSAIKDRLKRLDQADFSSAMRQAIKQQCDESTAKELFRCAREIMAQQRVERKAPNA